MKNLFLIGFFVLAFVLCFSGLVLAVVPNGAASVTAGASTTAPTSSPANNSAIAGNITELTITGYSTTQTWQGYFGNVSGAIRLADSSGDVMYNWSLAEPSGEVYASTADSITWSLIGCFDLSANGAAVETTYNIGSGDADGLDETFALNNHDAFYTNNILIAANLCNSTQLFDSTGTSVDSRFEEVLLSDGTNTIFASILEDTNVDGFDGNDHDFQMLVLEDGHETNTDTTPYYFYVELE